MGAYWFMFALPVIMAFMPFRASAGLSMLTWLGAAMFMIMMVGLRFEVGGDWAPYQNYFSNAYGQSFTDAVQLFNDPAYFALNWYFSNSGMGIWLLNLACAVLSVGGIMSLARRQPQPWLALAIAVPYVLVVVSMGYVRQSAALGLVCWALIAAQERRIWLFSFLIIIASAFHKSAVVMMPLFFLSLPRIKFSHLILFSTILATIIFVFVLETLQVQFEAYIEANKDSTGAFIRMAMNIPAAILTILFGRTLLTDPIEHRQIYWMSWACIISALFISFASTVVDRLSIYLLPLQMIVYGRVYRLLLEPENRSASVLFVLLAYAATLFIWLNNAVNAHAWIPYKFYPFF